MHISVKRRSTPARGPPPLKLILAVLALFFVIAQVGFLFHLKGKRDNSQAPNTTPALIPTTTSSSTSNTPSTTTQSQTPEPVQPAFLRKPTQHTVGPSAIDWGDLDDSTRMGTACFFTPYHITLGGGERYLLSSMKAAQSIGLRIEVLVTSDNVCQDVATLLDVSRVLRIYLSPAWLTLRTVSVTMYEILAQPRYDLFFLLGNEKYPMYKGLGRVNVYMCQFPFDLDRQVDAPHLAAFVTYHTVLLNSLYSLKWYLRFISPYLKIVADAGHLFPEMQILHPAVVPFELPAHKLDNTRSNIILLGRLFAGRQSKGHHIAIKLFKALRPDLPENTRLILAGNVWPGEVHEKYVADLRTEAEGLPIDFLLGQSSEAIQDALSSSLVQWHMTGLAAYSRDDPADHEHFGISIVEGMSAGCLPIAYCVGGAGDIIAPGENNGYLACSEDEFVQHTRSLFQATDEERTAMRKSGLRTAKRFDVETFQGKFVTAVFRDFLTLTVRHYIKQIQPVIKALPLKSAGKDREVHKAVIIEGRMHHAFSFVCRKTLLHLGSDWALQVFHSRLNNRFVREVLSDVQGVQFSFLDTDVIDIPYYNRLTKSEAFWDMMGTADKVLIFQVDTLILTPTIDPFIKYDFVGAPWHGGNERWNGLLRDMLPDGVGNGGFSLRSVAASKEVVRRYGASSPADEQEDLFFAINFQRLGYHIAPRQAAYDFCLEVPCMDLTQPQGHFALHAGWYYATRIKLRKMLDDSLPIPLYDD